MKSILYGLILLLMLPLTSLHAQKKTYPVSLAEVKPYTSLDLSWFNASVISLQDIEISAEMNGRLQWMAAFGEQVKKGQVIARIDSRELELQYLHQQQVLKKAQQVADFRSRELKRLESMQQVQGVSKTDLDQARHDQKMSQFELEEEQINLQLMEAERDKARIIAPFPGVVSLLHLQAGEYVTTGQSVVTLVNRDTPIIRVYAPVELVKHLDRQTAIKLRAKEREGSARMIARAYNVDEQSHLVEIRLQPSQPGQWIIGQALQVGLPRNKGLSALEVPRDALVIDQQGKAVFRVNGDNTVQRVAVELHSSNLNQVAISGDLKVGDRVVVRGSGMLKEGDKIDPI